MKNLIISTSDDYSTLKVQRWLAFYGKESVIINETVSKKFNRATIGVDDFEINMEINNEIIDFSKFDAYWYRRSNLRFQYTPVQKHQEYNGLSEEINLICDDEAHTISSFLDTYLSGLPSINKYKDNSINKLTSLLKAKERKILIPTTYILTEKKQVSELLADGKELIIKNINQGSVVGHTSYFEGFVNIFDESDLSYLPDSFFPTLFQVRVNKKYEIRSFYLDGEFYSMAIFSQNDEQTQVDFRNYNYQKPNRNVPFKIPLELEKQLSHLMADLGLNSGSIDLLLDQENNLIFLEVNPIGQYEQVSVPCNYYLDEIIATKIIYGK